jgi:hypothetical protein
MREMKSIERDKFGQNWMQNELKKTCGSIDVHHQTSRKW